MRFDIDDFMQRIRAAHPGPVTVYREHIDVSRPHSTPHYRLFAVRVFNDQGEVGYYIPDLERFHEGIVFDTPRQWAPEFFRQLEEARTP